MACLCELLVWWSACVGPVMVTCLSGPVLLEEIGGVCFCICIFLLLLSFTRFT